MYNKTVNYSVYIHIPPETSIFLALRKNSLLANLGLYGKLFSSNILLSKAFFTHNYNSLDITHVS